MNINSEGKLDKGDQKNVTDYSKGSFLVMLPGGGYVDINREWVAEGLSLAPSGRYHVLYVDLHYGTSTFYVQQEDGFHWISHHYPPFVTLEFIDWIGQQIHFKNQ